MRELPMKTAVFRIVEDEVAADRGAPRPGALPLGSNSVQALDRKTLRRPWIENSIGKSRARGHQDSRHARILHLIYFWLIAWLIEVN